ncbi:MAG TPA: hypothetical protein IAD30_05500 [Bacteroidetes bacterium]|nr:hypothetical protein [Bacteroidota bacterium]
MESAERAFREFLAGAASVDASGVCATGALDGLTAGRTVGWAAGVDSAGAGGTCAAGALDGLTAGRTVGCAVFWPPLDSSVR